MPQLTCLIAIALGSGVGGYFLLPGWQWSGLVAVSLLILAYGALKDGYWRLMMAFIMLAAFSFGYWRMAERTEAVRAPVLPAKMAGVWLGGNVDNIEKTEKGWRITVTSPSIGGLTAEQTPANVRVTTKTLPDDLTKGDAIRARVTLFPPSPPVMPGAFDFSRHAYYQRLGAVGYVMSGLQRLGGAEGEEEHGIIEKINLTREHISARLAEKMSLGNAAVAAAMLVGKQEEVSQRIIDSMQQAGILHILSISGLHMALVTAFAFLLVRRSLVMVPYIALHWPLKKIASGLALLASMAYLALSGFPVPAERSFIMAALVLIAIMLDRQVQSIRLVAIAAIAVLLVQPENLISASFQLSFAAVTALVAYFSTARNRHVSKNPLLLPLHYLFSIAASSLVASLATFPFSLYHFGSASISGLVANMLAIPLTSFVTIPAGVLALITMAYGLDSLPLAVMDWSITWLLQISDMVNDKIGWVIHTVPPQWFVLAGVAYGGLIIVLTPGRWRLAGGAVIAAAWLTGIWLRQEPFLLVEEKYAAIHLQDGKWLLYGDKDGNWVTQQWQERISSKFVREDEDWSCDSFGCVAITDAGQVAFSANADAMVDDCSNAAIIVTDAKSAADCAALIITRRPERPQSLFLKDGKLSEQ